MKFSEELPGSHFLTTRTEGSLNELKVDPANKNLTRYKSNWLRYVTTTNSNRMAKVMLNYRQNGRRWLGRHLKRYYTRAKHVCQGLTGDGLWESLTYSKIHTSLITCHQLLRRAGRCDMQMSTGATEFCFPQKTSIPTPVSIQPFNALFPWGTATGGWKSLTAT